MIAGWDLAKVNRHVRWAREGGLRSLIEEDELDPRVHLANALERARYRRTHRFEGRTRALWVLGAQRSGTNMVMRALAAHGGTAVFNENHRKAFERFELKDTQVVRSLLDAVKDPVAVFKPLCDSDRAEALLELGGTDSRCLWIYRDVDARARSAVAKFGDANLTMMRALATGTDDGQWWARAVTDEQRSIIATVADDRMTAHEGAAAFWWLRNSMFFDHDLGGHQQVMLVDYGRLLAAPARTMAAIAAAVELDFSTRMVEHFEPRRSKSERLPLRSEIRALCDDLTAALDAEALP